MSSPDTHPFQIVRPPGPVTLPAAVAGTPRSFRTTAAVLEARNGWVAMAQDGHPATVLAEVESALRVRLEPRARAAALFVQALCLMMLGETGIALMVARELIALTRDTGRERAAWTAAGAVQARALLVELLRRDGQLEQAVEQLAHAAALASDLDDLRDPEVQTGLGALALAHRAIGVTEGSDEIQRLLATVEEHLPRHQRIARWSNLAFESAGLGVQALQRPPFLVRRDLLEEAIERIGRAVALRDGSTYRVVELERQVLGALPEALLGDPDRALDLLTGEREVADALDRGPEAASAQVFWAVGVIRTLVRTGRHPQAAAIGARALAVVREHAADSERRVLAYEVMLAENPAPIHVGSGTEEYLALAGRRRDQASVLLDALFRARVDLLRGADERKVLARAARLDPLTGLINRRGGADAISEAASLQNGEPVALLLIDLDGFKEVNDSQGHLAGDGVLREVSSALRTAARLEDVVARWGGDEFVVVATLDQTRAVALAERLLETVRARPQAPGARVSASIGVAIRTAPLDEHEWMQRADDAMYAAKRAGGDSVVVG